MDSLSLFIDSGAFSAYTKNINISIQDYIDFIKKYKKYINVYANLDVIGDPKQTLKNQIIMEDSGLSPIPCFHYKEDFNYLKYYLKKYDYIALGGMVKVIENKRINFLDQCFNIICHTKNRLPKVKVHGFGMTSFRIMKKYPWYSCDSTTWVIGARTGGVIIPRMVNGEYVYDEHCYRVMISNKHPDYMKSWGKHYNMYSPLTQRIINKWIHKMGYCIGESIIKDVNSNYRLRKGERFFNKEKTKVEKIIREGVINNYKMRDEVNIRFFINFEKTIPPWPWSFKYKYKNKIKGFEI